LTELWSDRLLEILILNAQELHFGQGLFEGELQRFYYDLSDRYTPIPKIKEDIEFQRGIIVMLKPEIFLSLGTELIRSVWTLEINAFRHH
jgi:hypothetical protein